MSIESRGRNQRNNVTEIFSKISKKGYFPQEKAGGVRIITQKLGDCEEPTECVEPFKCDYGP